VEAMVLGVMRPSCGLFGTLFLVDCVSTCM
jgi:hypothetical protein